jgi:segregation and condensation protein B
MPPSNLRSAVEALLFSSDQPLTLALLVDALESTEDELREALKALGDEYDAREAGVALREMAGGWIFATRPELHEWVARMLRGKRRTRLSRAALETMAIVAYKQPVTKSEIEAIRGVDASGVLATLLERNLVTIKGRSTVVGRPLLYGTTPEFLNYFGLRDLTELPRPEELRALVAAREPEQLEMMELDPASGMPLALTPAAAGAEAPASPEMEPAFSLADADAAIAQANVARAEAAMVFTEPADDAGASTAMAGMGDLVESSDDGEDEEYDDDEFEGDDDDEDDDELDDEKDEDAERPSLSLDERRGR